MAVDFKISKARFFLLVDLKKPSYCNFLESRKKNSKIILLFYLHLLNFVEKNNILIFKVQSGYF